MSGQDSSQDKPHDPTPHKLLEARKKGDIAKSTEVSAAAAYLGLTLALVAIGAPAAQEAGEALSGFLGGADRLTGVVLGPGGAGVMGEVLLEVMAAISPIFILPFLAALLSLLAQQAFVFAPSKLAPKLNRISPISTAKNKFGPTGLAEFAKSVVKMTAVGTVLVIFLRGEIEGILALIRMNANALPLHIQSTLVSLLAIVCAIATLIATIDVFWQRFNHARKLRMSFQELKDEAKHSEGDPHIRSKRRQRAQEIATNRMLAEVPKADVIIVNPTHYAVALKWSRLPGSAPICIAKGVDEVAARIRETAMAAEVPIHQDAPTARTLHALVDIGREIEPEHYAAVAAAIRFAEQVRVMARQRRH